MTGEDSTQSAADRVIALEAELESAGEATLSGDPLAQSRAVLHEWVKTVVGVVTSPGLGRVTLLHADGTQSSIASPRLPFLLSRPAQFGEAG